MKRFTETEKWRDPWFRRLTPKLKCLWQYLCDTCDAAGVIEVDFEQASFVIGDNLVEQDLLAFDGRLAKINGSKRVILKFIPFQYGRLTDSCPAHKPVYASMTRHGIGYAYPSDRVSLGIHPSSEVRVIPTGQDRTGQERKGQDRAGQDAEPCGGGPVDLENAFTMPQTVPQAADGVPQAFERFWAAYPNKKGYFEAQRAFADSGCSGIMTEILAAIEAQRRSPQWTEKQGRYIPNPANWLREGRWKDEVESKAPSYLDRELDRLKREADRL